MEILAEMMESTGTLFFLRKINEKSRMSYGLINSLLQREKGEALYFLHDTALIQVNLNITRNIGI